jgi:hypothetical protein
VILAISSAVAGRLFLKARTPARPADPGNPAQVRHHRASGAPGPAAQNRAPPSRFHARAISWHYLNNHSKLTTRAQLESTSSAGVCVRTGGIRRQTIDWSSTRARRHPRRDRADGRAADALARGAKAMTRLAPEIRRTRWFSPIVCLGPLLVYTRLTSVVYKLN